jgi:hypothetical protein
LIDQCFSSLLHLSVVKVIRRIILLFLSANHMPEQFHLHPLSFN